MDEIKQELENQKARLEMNTATNAGVIELYEKRKKEVRGLVSEVRNVILTKSM